MSLCITLKRQSGNETDANVQWTYKQRAKGKTKCKDVSTKVDTHLKLSTTRILSGVAALKKASSLVEAALSGVLYKKIHVPPASVVQ